MSYRDVGVGIYDRAPFGRIADSSLRERVAARIRGAIFSGYLKEGDRLVERRLAEQFETSITVVREALIELESQGLVTKKVNSRTHVTMLSYDDIVQLFAIRKLLEGYAVEQCARLGLTNAEIQQLDELYLQMVDAGRSNDVEASDRADYSFHQMIWSLSGNHHLHETLNQVTLRLFAHSAIRAMRNCSALDLLQGANSHSSFLKAIKDGRPEDALAAFNSACDLWLDNALACLKDSGPSEKTSLLEP